MNLLIIGLGNDYRSDDEVGRVVARKLAAESLEASASWRKAEKARH